jgi:ABC-type antimicrobial peptide transport system permease subunit
MLTLKMRKGTRAGLKDPYSILLSASAAESIFGKDDPINKTIKLDRQYDVKVTGVYEDLPDNTSFREIKIMMPWELWVIQNPWSKQMDEPWGSNFSQTFAQIADNTEMEKVSAKIKNVKLNNVSKDEAKYEWVVFLQPMSKWNLYNEFKNGKNIGGNIQYVWLFGIIGIFVLMLACINFMNLTTARSEKRAKEVGIRKTVGSMRWQLIRQFFAESYLIVLLAFIFCLILVVLLLPLFNDVAGKKIQIPLAKSVVLVFQSCIYFNNRVAFRKLPCILPFVVSTIESVERNFSCWQVCFNSPQGFSSNTVHCFCNADNRNYYRLPTDTTCKRPAHWIHPSWLDQYGDGEGNKRSL